jgi:acetyltransferase
VVAAFLGGTRAAPGVQALEEAGIPCYPFPEPAVKTLAGMARLAERRRASPAPVSTSVDPSTARAWLAGLVTGGPRRLGMLELAPLLAGYRIPVVASRLARSADEAMRAAEAVGFPVALKIVSPDITHKTEVGGVVLDLRDRAAVERAASAMLAHVTAARPTAAVHGMLVQSMVASVGKELLLGGLRDPQFGPLVVAGLGGIYVEIFADTAARLAPVSPAEALEMLAELRTAPLLRGARGEPPVDLEALAGVIARFAQLLVDLPELAEIEINPVMADAQGVVAVDARARLGA